MNIIEQGETFTFTFSVSGDTQGLTATMNVLQYPGATPDITRALTAVDGGFEGTLTSAETAALNVGQYFIHASASDADEDIREPIKLYVSKGWV